MPEVKVGDEVRVFDQNGRRIGQPEGGWPGTVVQVGRSLVTIDYGGRSESFRMDSGIRNDKYGGRYFKSLAEAVENGRRSAALAVLREHGVEVRPGHGLTVEQLGALAEVARKF